MSKDIKSYFQVSISFKLKCSGCQTQSSTRRSLVISARSILLT